MFSCKIWDPCRLASHAIFICILTQYLYKVEKSTDAIELNIKKYRFNNIGLSDFKGVVFSWNLLIEFQENGRGTFKKDKINGLSTFAELAS